MLLALIGMIATVFLFAGLFNALIGLVMVLFWGPIWLYHEIRSWGADRPPKLVVKRNGSESFNQNMGVIEIK